MKVSLKILGIVIVLLSLLISASAGGNGKSRHPDPASSAQKPQAQKNRNDAFPNFPNPDRIRFNLIFDIHDLPVKLIPPLIGMKDSPLHGPLTLTGKVQGRTGSSKKILQSLAGDADLSVGPGNLKQIGILGNIFAKMLSVASISSLFSGRLLNVMHTKGLEFQKLTAHATFNNGTLDLTAFHFGSDAMTLEAKGTVDLIREQVDIEAYLVPLATVDKALNFVPIAGRLASSFTKLKVDIKGPWKDPKIRTNPVKQLGKGILETIKNPKTLIKGNSKKE